MSRRFGNFTLAIKLWILVSCFVTICILFISIFFYFELINNDDATAFASIRKSQELRRSNFDSNAGKQNIVIPSEYDAIISVYHISITNGKIHYITFPSSRFGNLSIGFIKSMVASFHSQKAKNISYKFSSNDYNLYYLITKDENKDSGTITFTVNNANEELYKKAILIIISFSCFAIVFAMILAYIFARHFSEPLEILEQAAIRTALGDFDTPVKINRNDEIGKLSVAIDMARIELKKKDFLRQNAIQYVSHELKTPVMTILSYTQLITDRIYPLGDMDSSLRVIDEQAKRIQEIVMKLLTLTRLDFLEHKNPEIQKFDLAGICEDTAYRICSSRHELELKLELEDIVMEGQKDQITVLAENLIENAVRYADRLVVVSTGQRNKCPFLTVFNDGETIADDQISLLFEPFQKGKNGITGLGLSIVSRIVKNCGASIKVEKESDGVLFTVTFLPV